MPDGSPPAQSKRVRAAASASALLGRGPAMSGEVPEPICVPPCGPGCGSIFGLYTFMPSTSSILPCADHDKMGSSKPNGKEPAARLFGYDSVNN